MCSVSAVEPTGWMCVCHSLLCGWMCVSVTHCCVAGCVCLSLTAVWLDVCVAGCVSVCVQCERCGADAKSVRLARWNTEDSETQHSAVSWSWISRWVTFHSLLGFLLSLRQFITLINSTGVVAATGCVWQVAAMQRSGVRLSVCPMTTKNSMHRKTSPLSVARG